MWLRLHAICKVNTFFKNSQDSRHRSWGKPNHKNSIYRVHRVFSRHISAGSNTVLRIRREKLTQSTVIRLICIISPSHACVLLFSIFTIKSVDLLKRLASQKTHEDHLFAAEDVSPHTSCEEETVPAAPLPLRGRRAKCWQGDEPSQSC